MADEKSKDKTATTDAEQKEYDARIAGVKRRHARADSTGKMVPLSDVFELQVGDKKAYLRKPDRAIVAMSRTMGDGDYIKINELLLDGCWLEGDEEIRRDDDYFLAAIPVLQHLMEEKAVSLKKS